MKITVRTLLLLAAFAAQSALAATQLVLPAVATKASQPVRIKSIAQPVRFNLGELRALQPGAEVELTLPSGRKHALVFDQLRDHGQGIVSWVGYVRDGDTRHKLRAVVTTGPDGTFGSVQTPQGELRIVPGRGNDWLVDMAVEGKYLPDIDLAADGLAPPPSAKALATTQPTLGTPEYVQPVQGITVPKSAPAAPPMVTIDVLFVYTSGLAAKLPGSQMQTRIAQLVTAANTAYSDSGVGIQLRAAGSVVVDYTDTNDDNTALSDITWARDPVFSNIAATRDKVGADLVTFLRAGGDLTGNGVAWVPPHPVAAGDAATMYSIVTGCNAGCEWVWMHELGHNMGNAHDRATAAWEVSGLKQSASRGSYDYSYGFYTCNGAYGDQALSCPAFSGGCTSADFEPQCSYNDPQRNYADIMAYFHLSTRLNVFSNPDLNCNGTDLPCGLPDGYLDNGRAASSNTALSMNNNRVALSALRSVSTTSSQAVTAVALASSANPARVGTTTTLTATVTAYANGAFVPAGDGTVRFRANGADIAGCSAVAVSSGIARCATVFAAGTYTITAEYAGSATYGASTSPAITQAIAALDAVATTVRARSDFNADGNADLVFGGSSIAVSLMSGTTSSGALVGGPAGATLRARGDFDGDGRTDLLWRANDGSYTITLMDGANVRASAQVMGAGTGWDVVGIADLDGDGRADLVWNTPDGHFGAWLMQGTSMRAQTTFDPPTPGSRLAFLADINGDGHPDFVWRGADESIAITLQSNGAAAGSAVLLGGNTGWTLAGAGDINGDGFADLLVANADGRLAGWLLRGGSIVGARVLLDAGTGWSLAAVGDLDGDGQADLVLTKADQSAAAWLMDGLSVRAGANLIGANSGWSFAALADVDGDGRQDMLWRRGTGDYGLWLMSGLQARAYGALPAPNGGDLVP